MSIHSKDKSIPWRRFLIVAVSMEVLYLLLTRFSQATRLPPYLFMQSLPFFAVWAALFLLYGLVVHASRNVSSKRATFFVLATSLLFRATLIPAPMTPPPAPQLIASWSSPLGDAVETIAHGLTPVIPRPWAKRSLVTAADMAALALAPGLLKAAGLPGTLSILYGWNPLAVTESAVGEHLHPLALLLFVLSIRALVQGSRLRAALAYGLSLTGGLWTATCLPYLLRLLRAHGMITVVVAIAFWGARWVSMPPEIPASLPACVGGSLLPAAASVGRVFLTRDPTYPLALLTAVWLGLLLFRAWRRRPDPGEVPLEALMAIGTLLMILPQVFPWFFLPVAYFAAFSGNRGWLVFTATAPLTYFAYRDGEWSQWSFWLGFAQFFPAYFALVFGWLGKPSRFRPT